MLKYKCGKAYGTRTDSNLSLESESLDPLQYLLNQISRVLEEEEVDNGGQYRFVFSERNFTEKS